MHVCTHVCMHTYIHTYVCTYIHTYIHTVIITLNTTSLSPVGEEGSVVALEEWPLLSDFNSEDIDKWLHSSLNTGTTHLEQHNSPSRAYPLLDNFY